MPQESEGPLNTIRCSVADCVLFGGHRSAEHGDDHQSATGAWFNFGRSKTGATLTIEEALDAAADLATEDLKNRAQAFFADYAAKIRAPHYGPLHREVIVDLLVRAEEAGLYKP